MKIFSRWLRRLAVMLGMASQRKRILISVTDKKDVAKWGRLERYGWEIISTGGTAKELREAGVACTLVEDITGFPEMLSDRVKTLHPRIHAGILAIRSMTDHMQSLRKWGIEAIDVVVVNLYQFLENPGLGRIDIGGSSLLRAAAKNGQDVVVVVDPNDYEWVIPELAHMGTVSIERRERLAAKVFRLTGTYDTAIADWMEGKVKRGEPIFLRPVDAKR